MSKLNTVNILKTPLERFKNLPDYSFLANYFEYKLEGTNNKLNIHYVDEGPKNNKKTILLLHGEPSWSYLYRKMIPILSTKYRVIAPDLLGFGKSDKLDNIKGYSYKLHVDIMSKFVEMLNLKNITPFFQDWGGLIGLRLVGIFPDRFDKIIAGNTGFPSASGIKGLLGGFKFRRIIKKRGIVTAEMLKERPSFVNWVAYSQTVPELPIGKTIAGGVIKRLSDEEMSAYDAPFPDEKFKAGARVFPALVPTQLSQNHKIWKNVLEKWKKPFILTFSDKDPITKGMKKEFIDRIPREILQDITIRNAGHFLQEDAPDELCKIILDSME